MISNWFFNGSSSCEVQSLFHMWFFQFTLRLWVKIWVKNFQLSFAPTCNQFSRYQLLNFISKCLPFSAWKILYPNETIFGNPISCIPWSIESHVNITLFLFKTGLHFFSLSTWEEKQPLNNFTVNANFNTFIKSTIFINTVGFIVAGRSNLITPILNGGIFFYELIFQMWYFLF